MLLPITCVPPASVSVFGDFYSGWDLTRAPDSGGGKEGNERGGYHHIRRRGRMHGEMEGEDIRRRRRMHAKKRWEVASSV